MLKNRMSFRVAFCGILAALMTVIMLVGPLIPTMTYVAPAAAGVFLIPVVWDFGGKAGGLLYAAVALLAFFLAPDKEAALCFVLLFGWYPVARPKLQHIRQKPVRLVVKLALFNAALLAIYALLLFVFVMPDLQQEAQSWTALLLVAFFFMVVPAILSAWIKTPFIKALAAFCQPQVIMIIGAVLCAFLKLGKEKDIIRKIPISTIVMIVGVYTLIKVAAKAGLIDWVSAMLAGSIPAWLLPGAIVLFAGFLSFFSSSTSTVMPLMYPMVPGLVAAFAAKGVAINPVALYTCIFFGGLSTACSPFSTGGALTIASCPDNQVKEELSNKMIVVALIVPVITIIAAELGLFNFFTV